MQESHQNMFRLPVGIVIELSFMMVLKKLIIQWLITADMPDWVNYGSESKYFVPRVVCNFPAKKQGTLWMRHADDLTSSWTGACHNYMYWGEKGIKTNFEVIVARNLSMRILVGITGKDFTLCRRPSLWNPANVRIIELAFLATMHDQHNGDFQLFSKDFYSSKGPSPANCPITFLGLYKNQ